MSTREEISTKIGKTIFVEKHKKDNFIEIALRIKENKNCMLHWGLMQQDNNVWKIPPTNFWPKSTTQSGNNALQTPFLPTNGESRINISLEETFAKHRLAFVLFYPEENCWDNNKGKNYCIHLPNKDDDDESNPLDFLLNKNKGKNIIFSSSFILDNKNELAALVKDNGNSYIVELAINSKSNLVLHWGVSYRSRNEWTLPKHPQSPPNTEIQNKALQTKFAIEDNLNTITLTFEKETAPSYLVFVFYEPQGNKWYKNNGQNFTIPLGQKESISTLSSEELEHIANIIIAHETSKNSWTLMHRFNLCHDLSENLHNSQDGLALLYVWLRFSFLRQLTWQKNYNTKPKELSHSQDRLTLKLSNTYTDEQNSRFYIRLILSTLSPGGDGQRIRDEILQIMHRHKIKEVSGHFMEEWHQKLHNNTTPDDIAICEAYLDFLKSNGDLKTFYDTLNRAGVTKERLENFERPIKTHPDFVPHIKDGLIHDFTNYLKILKNVHSSTDLERAANWIKSSLDKSTNEALDFLLYKNNGNPLELSATTSWVRKKISDQIKSQKNTFLLRNLLYLDIALEEYHRVLIEGNIHNCLDIYKLSDLIVHVLECLCLTYNDDELKICLNHWNLLLSKDRQGIDWAMNAISTIERINRVLGRFVDNYYETLQSKAQYLGDGLNIDNWVIQLFSEEVVRGRLEFALSKLLHNIEPILRQSAKVGNWQIISRNGAWGKIEIVGALRNVQDKTYNNPTIIITEKINGDEEVPKGVKAIITTQRIDLVSHVSVRARNAGILFATCFQQNIIDELKALKEQIVKITALPSGEIEFSIEDTIDNSYNKELASVSLEKMDYKFSAYILSPHHYEKDKVGLKSYNLKVLSNKIPLWVNVPKSMTIPFGVCEEMFHKEQNKDLAFSYNELAKDKSLSSLEKLRDTIMQLKAPDTVMTSLRKAFEDNSIPMPSDCSTLWQCIKRVWASKWNDRAYISRNNYGIAHENLFMAVLIQEVVPAEYSFVIHTVNPYTGDENEIYAEIVPGLGETLVGNYPGRAFGFKCRKDNREPFITSYPGKSTALYSEGLIFRSDSNAEDLVNYSAAGLYESVLVNAPKEKLIDYTKEQIICNDTFRRKFFLTLTDIAILIERAMAYPQDIEGAYANGKYYVVQSRAQAGIK
ncbi:alpha-glucan water dikinase, chloroplastic [Candidatus Magnetoovum chiemensis]|nr:alpha-glucan water dikinase, chloroplastic [Candidatus Magnetoovum chiemensis]